MSRGHSNPSVLSVKDVMNTPMHATNKTRLALLGIVAGAAALRLVNLGGEDLWLDECITAEFASEPTLAGLLGRLSRDISSPLAYGLARLALHLKSLLGLEAALRLPSALAGIASVPLVFRFVKGRLGSRAGLLAASLLAVHSQAIHHAREARFYALVLFFALLLHLAVDRLRASWRSRDAVVVGAVGGALGLTHALALPLVAAELLLLAVVVWRTQAERARKARCVLVSAGVFVASTIPLAVLVSKQVGMALGGDSPTSLRTLESIGKFLAGVSESARDPLFVLGPLVLVGCVAAWRTAKRDVAVAGLALAAPLLVFWVIPPRYPIHARYFSALLPLALLFCAHGALCLAELAKTRWGKPGGKRVWAALTIGLVLVQVRPLREDLGQQNAPYTEAVSWLAARMGPKARVLLHFHGSASAESAVPAAQVLTFYGAKGLEERLVDPFTLALDAPDVPTFSMLTLRARHAREARAWGGAVRLHPQLYLLPAGPEGESTRAAVNRLAAFDRRLPGHRQDRWEAAFGRWVSDADRAGQPPYAGDGKQ